MSSAAKAGRLSPGRPADFALPGMVSEAGPKEKPPCDVRCIAADSKDGI